MAAKSVIVGVGQPQFVDEVGSDKRERRPHRSEIRGSSMRGARFGGGARIGDGRTVESLVEGVAGQGVHIRVCEARAVDDAELTLHGAQQHGPLVRELVDCLIDHSHCRAGWSVTMVTEDPSR